MKNNSDFYCDEVLSGKTKVNIEYESGQVLAFHHTKPSYQTHIVIVPKKHINSLSDIKEEDKDMLWEIMTVVKRLAEKLDPNEGIRLVTNLGKFQDSSHLHFHLISGKK